MNTQLVKTLSEIIKSLSEDEQQQLKNELTLEIQSEITENHRKSPFWKTASSEEWVSEFSQWAESHRDKKFPHLSDEDISRESIYGERG